MERAAHRVRGVVHAADASGGHVELLEGGKERMSDERIVISAEKVDRALGEEAAPIDEATLEDEVLQRPQPRAPPLLLELAFTLRRFAPRSRALELQGDELAAIVALLREPIGVDQPRSIVGGRVVDLLQERLAVPLVRSGLLRNRGLARGEPLLSRGVERGGRKAPGAEPLHGLFEGAQVPRAQAANARTHVVRLFIVCVVEHARANARIVRALEQRERAIHQRPSRSGRAQRARYCFE